MKKIIFLALFGLAGLLPTRSLAQVSLNVNIGSQPLWGPAGYDHADYYYMPDVESYYNVPTRQFIYLENGSWVTKNSLPSRFSTYNLYNGYKVVMNTPKPYLLFADHKVKYAKFKANKSQAVIAKSKNPKYFVVKGHPGKGPAVSNIASKGKSRAGETKSTTRVNNSGGGNAGIKAGARNNAAGGGNGNGKGGGKGKH